MKRNLQTHTVCSFLIVVRLVGKISKIIKMNCTVGVILGTLRSLESIINRQAAVMNSGSRVCCFNSVLAYTVVLKCCQNCCIFLFNFMSYQIQVTIVQPKHGY